MAKMYVLTLGYRDYAVPMDMGPTLLMMLGELREVKQPDYRKPYEYQARDEASPVCDTIRLIEVIEPPRPVPAPEAGFALVEIEVPA